MDHQNKDFLFRPQNEGMKHALGNSGELFKITIPITERIAALQHLELMNINAFSLFGHQTASFVRSPDASSCFAIRR
jgi:hypothetical protein